MLTLQYTLLNIIYFALNVAVAGYGYNYLSSLAIFQVAGMIKTAEIGYLLAFHSLLNLVGQAFFSSFLETACGKPQVL